MKRLILFLAAISMPFAYVQSQQIVPIPDHDFWDVSYTNYKFHFEERDASHLEKKYPYAAEQSFSEIAKEVDSCFSGHCRWGNKIHITDTSLSTLLPKTYALWKKVSIIDREYEFTGDSLYSSFLIFAYNTSIQTDSNQMEFFLQKAIDAYNKIPDRYMTKALSYLQLNYIGRHIRKKDYILDFKLLANLDSVSRDITGDNFYSYTELSNYNECLGDYQAMYTVIESWLPSYKKALYFAERITPSSERTFVVQRIREKLISALMSVNGQLRKDLNTEIAQQLDSLYSQSENVQEFKYHNNLIIAGFNNSLGLGKKYEDRLMLQSAKSLYADGPHRLDMDVTMALSNFQLIAYNNKLYSLAKKGNIAVLNECVYNNSLKKINYWGCLSNTFLCCVLNGDYEDAGLINKYILLDAESHGSSYIQNYLTNIALILTYQHQLDSAQKVLTRVTDTIENFKDYSWYMGTKATSYLMLRNLAALRNDGITWNHYDSIYKTIGVNTSQILAHVTNEDTKFKRDMIDVRLYNQIDYYQAWGNENLLRKLAVDSLLILANRNDSLNKKIFSDSLNTQRAITESKAREVELQKGKAQLNKQLAEEIARDKDNQMIRGFLIFLVIMLVVVFAMQFRNNVIKRRSVEFELDSYKGAFFGHAIEKSFQSIETKIHKGIITESRADLEIAKSITNGLSSLFHEVANDLPESSNLYREIQLGLIYVATMSLVYKNEVEVILNVEESVAENIVFPQRLLIHLFVNALEHAQLRTRENSKIIITLYHSEMDNAYILTIMDNGIGFEKPVRRSRKGPGGLSIMERGFMYFNQTKQRYSIQFSSHSDVKKLHEIGGTLVTIKLFKNDKY